MKKKTITSQKQINQCKKPQQDHQKVSAIHINIKKYRYNIPKQAV